MGTESSLLQICIQVGKSANDKDCISSKQSSGTGQGMPLKSQTRLARVSLLLFFFYSAFVSELSNDKQPVCFPSVPCHESGGSLERRARRLEVRIWLTWIRWLTALENQIEKSKKKRSRNKFPTDVREWCRARGSPRCYRNKTSLNCIAHQPTLVKE